MGLPQARPKADRRLRSRGGSLSRVLVLVGTVLIVLNRGGNEIIVVENWFEEVTRLVPVP